MRVIGMFSGATIGLEWRDGSQIIVLSVPQELSPVERNTVYSLASTLSSASGMAIHDGELRIEIAHTDDVDRRRGIERAAVQQIDGGDRA